ncbi:MAG TPA: hypothetical protein VEK15_05070 [Vicinamibacteria bacterium]|nr:hypothetical protein [Vicinamibacteria bacterium]
MPDPGLRLPVFLPPESEETGKRSWRAISLGVAALVTVFGLATALFLGTLGYEIRRSNMHEARLKGILVQTPTVYQVTEGLKEKAPLAAIVESGSDLDDAVARWGGSQAGSIREKARQWPQLRVYAAGDMMYFIYFDAEDVMRDYLYVTN